MCWRAAPVTVDLTDQRSPAGADGVAVCEPGDPSIEASEFPFTVTEAAWLRGSGATGVPMQFWTTEPSSSSCRRHRATLLLSDRVVSAPLQWVFRLLLFLPCCCVEGALPAITIQDLCACVRQAEARIHSLAVSEEQLRAEWNGTDAHHLGRTLGRTECQYRMAECWAKEYSRFRRFPPEVEGLGSAASQIPYTVEAFNGRFGTALLDSIGIVRGERSELLRRSVLYELHHPGGMHLADALLQDHILVEVEGERTVAGAECYSVLTRNRKAVSATGAYVGTWGRLAIAPRYGFVAVELVDGKMEEGKECTRRTYRFSDFDQGAEGFWMPRRYDVWVAARGSGDPSIHSVVWIREVTVNPPVADSDFAVDFPPGTRIQDWRSGVGFQLPVDDEVTEQTLRELLRRGGAAIQSPPGPDSPGAVPSESRPDLASPEPTPHEPSTTRPAGPGGAASHEMADAQPREGPRDANRRVGRGTGALLTAATAGLLAGLASAAVFVTARRRRKEG